MTLDYKKIKRIIPDPDKPRFEGCRDTVVSYEIECTFHKHGEIEIPFLSLYKYYTRQHVLENQREEFFEKAKKEKCSEFHRELIDPEISEIFFRECQFRNNPHYASTAIKMILPFLKDPVNYFWKEIKEILMLTLSQASLDDKTGDPRVLGAVTRWVKLLLLFVSNVFGAKWEVGLGDCWKDPDPEDFSYPRSQRDYRAFLTWQEEVFFQTVPKLAKELGLTEILDCFELPEDTSATEDIIDAAERIVEQVFEHSDLERFHKEQEILDQEMRRRGISFELFYQQNRARFPEQGAYRNLDQVLRETLNLFQEEKISEETLYHEGEKTLFDVWNDYYGRDALERDFLNEFYRYLHRHEFILDTFLEHQLMKDPAKIYGMIAKIESVLHDFIKERLVAHFGECEDGWWVKGVPANIRVRCQTAREQDSERFDAFAYTYLVELKEIILKNWEIFKPYLEDKQKKSLKKEKQLEWIDQLNHLRNLVMHPLKRSLTTDEARFISDCLKRVENLRIES